MKLMACIMVLLPASSFGRRIDCKEFDSFGKLCKGDKVRALRTRIVDGERKFTSGQVGVVEFFAEIWPGDFKPFIKWKGSSTAKWLTPRSTDLKKLPRNDCYTCRGRGGNCLEVCVGDRVEATKTRRVNGTVKFSKGQTGRVKKIATNSSGQKVPYVLWDGTETAKWLTPSSSDLKNLSRSSIGRRNLRSGEQPSKEP